MGLWHHCGWSQGLQSGCQVPDTSFVVSHAPSVAAGSNAHIQSGLGHVDAHVDWFLIHVSPPRDSERGPSLHDAGLANPGNCSGSAELSSGGLRRTTASSDQDDSNPKSRYKALDRGEAGGPDPPLHHALVAVDELKLRQLAQVLGMIHTLGPSSLEDQSRKIIGPPFC